MTKIIPFKFLHRILLLTKEFWFFITLILSGLLAIFYFLFFDVNPLQRQYESKIQSIHCGFNNDIGTTFLRQGYYEKAKDHFEKTLKLRSYDKDALNGRFFSELFVNLSSIDYDPAIADKIKNAVCDLALNPKLCLVREKYIADLDRDIVAKIAKYETIIKKDPGYIDVYYSYGWLCYELLEPNLEKMYEIFKKMIIQDKRDYRAYHGLGYAMYMQALKEEDKTKQKELLLEAARNSKEAFGLIKTRINVAMDLGDIARTVDPSLAIQYHVFTDQLLNDPGIRNLPDNKGSLYYRLLKRQGGVRMETLDDKRAYVKYALALDYLSLYRKQKTNSTRNKIIHDKLYEEGRTLDTKKIVDFIYMDQKEVLDSLLPGGRRATNKALSGFTGSPINLVSGEPPLLVRGRMVR